MKSPILISLSPNTEKEDISLAIRTITNPWKWFEGTGVLDLENQFGMYFAENYRALAVNSGRSALYLILKAMGIKKGDEVAIQALTCVAVPNSVLWNGAKPLYIDVDDTLNMDYKDLSKKLTRKTKAIIVQHSFGYPARMEEIIKIAKTNNIPVIEDCALSLGGSLNGKKLGTLGDISFFSFGRDKVISGVFGGMILCRDQTMLNQLMNLRESLSEANSWWTFQQLLNPILMAIVKPLYFFGAGKITIGKILLFIFQKVGLLSKAVYEMEKIGQKPNIFPAKMPDALAKLALNQFSKLDRFNMHRKSIVQFYNKNIAKVFKLKILPFDKGAVWVRYPIITNNSSEILETFKSKNILLGDWYKNIIVPVTDLKKIGYVSGSCPKAEKMVGNIINLPTYPSLTLKDAGKVVRLLNICLK